MRDRIRTRCRVCKERVNLKFKRENRRFVCMCPKCGAHGDLKLVTKK